MDLSLRLPATRLVLGILAVMLVVDLIGLHLTGMVIERSAIANWTKGFLGFAAILLTCVAVHWRLRRDQAVGARRLKLGAERVATFAVAALLLGAFTTAAAVFSYIMAATNLPLQDALLADLDGKLGFDWHKSIALACSHPAVETTIAAAYGSLKLQSALLVVLLALTGQRERLFEFIALFAVTAFVCSVVFAFVPALGAYYHYGVATPRAHAISGNTLSYYADSVALREGRLGVIDLPAIKGIVTFPSFHTALACCIAFAAWRTRFVAWPVIAINIAVIIGTIPIGGHYFIDLLGGAAITGAAIILVRRLALPASFALPSPSVGSLASGT